MQDMDALNCQFYKTRVAKVSCYRYRRRRCVVYRRRLLITKSPRGDKVIIEREKKNKIRLAVYLQNYMLGLVQSERANTDATKCVKVFIRDNGEAKFI